MGNVISLQKYYEDRLIARVIEIKEEFNHQLDRLEKKAIQDSRLIEILELENKILRNRLQQYEQEAQTKKQ